MKKSEILAKVDHTELRPNATREDYARLADEACQNGVASVCVPPSVVRFMNLKLKGQVPVGTVVGFPNGYSTTETKCWEAQHAILQGAKEIDMVINVGLAVNMMLSERWNYIREEVGRIRDICSGNIILKMIIETCYLSDDAKISLCMIANDYGVDYVKTSTGFGPKGAELSDIGFLRGYLNSAVKIKAAGGIDTIEKAKQFIEAGCDRIGSSKLVKLLADIDDNEI